MMLFRRAVRWILSSLLLALAARSVRAADADGTQPSAASILKKMSVEDLLAQNVESVSRKPETLSEAASSVFLIPGQAATTIGATSLPEVLRLATNLFVAESSSSTWAVNARGFVRSNSYSNKLLVMIDGRTVYSPLFSNVFWDSTSVFLPDLDRIEVISGPAGSTWGANAVNGVINIATKSARDTLGGLLSVNAGNEAQSFGARYGVPVGPDGALRVYAQATKFEPTLDTNGHNDDLDPWKSVQGGFRSDWGAAATGEFTVQGDVFSGRYQNGAAPESAADSGNLLARWSRDLSPDSHLWLRAYEDYSKRDTQGAINEISRTSDFEFQHRLGFADTQELLWGANYRFMSDSIDHTLGFAILPPKLDFALGSVFAQHQIEFASDALRLTTGLRLEHNHFSGWEYEPSVRLAWQRSRQTAWLAFSRATRIPSRLDTGFYFPETPPYIAAGGPDFQSEVLLAYEAGWRVHPTKTLSVTTTFYYSDYSNLRTTQLSTPIIIANGAEGDSYGMEVFVDWDVRPWWRMRVGGFSIDQNTHLKPGRTDSERGIPEASFPDYEFQFRNSFNLGNAVTFWTSLRHVDAVPGYDIGVYTVVPAYTELDASLTWRVNAQIEFTLSGRNLLHASHPEIGSTAIRREIPRTVQGSVRWGF